MTTQHAAPAQERPPSTLEEVEAADVTILALMKRDQVDALPDAARRRRVERMLSPSNTTLWKLADISAYTGRPLSTVKTWRWRTGRPEFETFTSLPEPPSTPVRTGRGGPQPLWPMTLILNWAREENRCDRHDYVAFPEPRSSPGRTPDAVKAARAQAKGGAPAQRTGSTAIHSAA